MRSVADAMLVTVSCLRIRGRVLVDAMPLDE